jgi:hypothetical protein
MGILTFSIFASYILESKFVFIKKVVDKPQSDLVDICYDFLKRLKELDEYE